MEFGAGGGASEVLGHLAAGVAGGVAGNTDLLKMAQSGKQHIRPTIDSLPDKVRRWTQFPLD